MPRNFTAAEVRGLHPELVRMLDDARDLAGVSFVITSGFRRGDPKAHGLGKAVDLRCRKRSSVKRMKMVTALIQVGFKRIGVYDSHVHCDIATKAEGFPQRVMWWGKSS